MLWSHHICVHCFFAIVIYNHLNVNSVTFFITRFKCKEVTHSFTTFINKSLSTLCFFIFITDIESKRSI